MTMLGVPGKLITLVNNHFKTNTPFLFGCLQAILIYIKGKPEWLNYSLRDLGSSLYKMLDWEWNYGSDVV